MTAELPQRTPLTLVNETTQLPGASDSITQIAAALAKAQGAMQHASKDQTNPHFRQKYADLASVIDAVREPFAKNGLSFMQRTSTIDSGVTVTTILLHESGEWISDTGLPVPVSKNDAQGVGSALTYGRRYTLMAMAGLAPDDDDGNAAAAAKYEPPKAATVKKLTAKQMSTLVEKLVQSGMTKPEAAKAASGITPDKYTEAVKRADARIAEAAEAASDEVPPCTTCSGKGADETTGEVCQTCSGTGTQF